MHRILIALWSLSLLGLAHSTTKGGDYSEAAATALESWSEWKEAQSSDKDLTEKTYKPSKSKDGRVLVFAPRGTSASKLLKSSKKTVAVFDELFPPASREDAAPPVRTAVLFPIAGPKSFTSITAAAAKSVAGLQGWASAAPRGVGFLLEDPLAGGWLLEVPNSEVWNVENELVNRLARLLTIERYGRQPHWLSQGIAWRIEQDVCKDVYCFPYRNGFVSKKEHRSWSKRLPQVMTARGERPLAMADLHGWKRNTWDANSAALASGAVDMLAKHYETEFSRVLAAFAARRVRDGRATESDGSWTVIGDYEIPPPNSRRS